MILDRPLFVTGKVACVLSIAVIACSLAGLIWLYDAKAVVAVIWGVALLVILIAPKSKGSTNG